jgi:hypothetical protein
MLERIVPLMDHPPDSFLHNLDNRIDDLLQTQNVPLIISACVSCCAAIYNRFPKFCPKLFGRFAKFLGEFRLCAILVSFFRILAHDKGIFHDYEFRTKDVGFAEKDYVLGWRDLPLL